MKQYLLTYGKHKIPALAITETHAFLPHYDLRSFSQLLSQFSVKNFFSLVFIGETRLRFFVSDLFNTCSANSRESTISSVGRTYAFRASCMSKTCRRANINAFEQNKGRGKRDAMDRGPSHGGGRCKKKRVRRARRNASRAFIFCPF